MSFAGEGFDGNGLACNCIYASWCNTRGELSGRNKPFCASAMHLDPMSAKQQRCAFLDAAINVAQHLQQRSVSLEKVLQSSSAPTGTCLI